MTSIHERPALTPAQYTKRLIEQAKERAALEEWEEYEQENRAQLAILRGREHRPITHGMSGYRRGCRCDECKASRAQYAREWRARQPKREKPEPQGMKDRTLKEWMHGSQTGYVYGCRCDRCREAWRVSRPKSNTKHGTEYGYRKGCRCRSCVKAERDARYRRLGRTPPRVSKRPHGTRAKYSAGCRCSKCKLANREYTRERRAREKRHAEVSQSRENSTAQTVTHPDVLPVEVGHNQETL